MPVVDETWTAQQLMLALRGKAAKEINVIGFHPADGFIYFTFGRSSALKRAGPFDDGATFTRPVSGGVTIGGSLIPDALLTVAPASLPVGVYDGANWRTLRGRAQGDAFVQLRTAGAVEYDARARTWLLGATDVPDLSDRVGRLLGIVASITAAVDVSDRAARETGRVREWGNTRTWVDVKSAAPGIGAVQADTGALAAGDYDFDILLVVSDTNAVGKGLVVEHRDAANAATLHNLGGCSVPGNQTIHIPRYTLALNERIRVIAGTAAGAAASMYVSAIGRRVAG